MQQWTRVKWKNTNFNDYLIICNVCVPAILSGQEQSECKLYLSTFSTYKFWIGLLKVQTTTTAVTTTAAVEDVVDNNDSNSDDEDGGEDDADDVSSLITTTKYKTSEIVK